MRRNSSFLNFFISIFLTIALLFLLVYVASIRYGNIEFTTALIFVGFALISGIIHTFIHEIGHLIFGLKNGYKFNSMTVLFFNWTKINDKIAFKFTMMKQEAGWTEMMPSEPNKVKVGLKEMTFGGLFFSFLLMLVGVAPFFIQNLPLLVFSAWAMLLPVGAYVFFGNAVPCVNEGVRNDGAVILGLRKNDNVSQVTVGVLKIQALLYQGYSPSEINESYYFDLPVIQEDDANFIMLLNLRYLYYLDKEDYLNAKKVSDRLYSLVDEVSFSFNNAIKTDTLYNVCTFDYNEKMADDLMYELEKFLNNVNNASTVRTKLAYILYVAKNYLNLELFYNKGVKEIEKIPLEGVKKLETKLYEKIKKDIDNIK